MFSFDNRFSTYRHVIKRRDDIEKFIKELLATKDYLDRLDYNRDSATGNYFIELPPLKVRKIMKEDYILYISKDKREH